MALHIVIEIFKSALNDEIIRTSILVITAFTIFLAVTFSPLAAFVVYSCYLFGYAVCWCLITYHTDASIGLQRLASFYRGCSNKKNIKSSCSICDDLSCKRHLIKSVMPWRNLRVHKELNEAVEQFYNRILDDFIVSWYRYLTDDEDFLNELRYCLKYSTSCVVNRLLELDVPYIISNKLLPCAVKHIDDYLYMQQIAKLKNIRFNDVITEYLGKRLHVAASNRKNELAYLQHLTNNLLPIILPDKYLTCRNYAVLIREILSGWALLPLMDVLADPNVINALVILCITYKKSKKKSKVYYNVEREEFLCKFGLNDSLKKSSFAYDLNSIKQQTELFYGFMQFLKKEEQVHLLQFCLDVDEFNNKLLAPEHSMEQLESLHSEAMKLYKEYLNQDSVNCIGCSKEIVDNFNYLLQDNFCNVNKLRTSKPLYEAYEFAFNTLENVWLPVFFHSNEFYVYICGSKTSATYSKSTTNKSALLNFGSPTRQRSRKYYEQSGQGTVAKISSGLGRIKGALKTNQPIEGAVYPTESQTIENEAVEDLIINEGGENVFRDLSAWKVSISQHRVENKHVSFCIGVERFDEVGEEDKKRWVVWRKDQDFFTLKAKLIEFHGENEICDSPLPSRKAGNSVEMRMGKYADFVKRLLLKPTLRGSDLLYTFLTTDEDFTFLAVTSASSIQDLGNIYQSVAHKLRKEKGQHLDSFMSTFLTSTGRTKQGKFEWAEMGDEISVSACARNRNPPPPPKTYRNHIFNDNFGVEYATLKDTSNTSFNPIGFTECLFYLLKHILKVPHILLKLYAAVCTVGQQGVEYVFKWFIDHKIRSGLCESNLAYLIKLLEEIVFQTHVPPTKKELEERKERAFRELRGVISPFASRVMGRDVTEGFAIILEILQHPHYNKQLAYSLFDIVVTEMYPTLGQMEK